MKEKELNEKEWKELQDIVKEKDKLQGDLLGTNLFVAEFTIDTKKDCLDEISNEKGQ